MLFIGDRFAWNAWSPCSQFPVYSDGVLSVEECGSWFPGWVQSSVSETQFSLENILNSQSRFCCKSTTCGQSTASSLEGVLTFGAVNNSWCWCVTKAVTLASWFKTNWTADFKTAINKTNLIEKNDLIQCIIVYIFIPLKQLDQYCFFSKQICANSDVMP